MTHKHTSRTQTLFGQGGGAALRSNTQGLLSFTLLATQMLQARNIAVQDKREASWPDVHAHVMGSLGTSGNRVADKLPHKF